MSGIPERSVIGTAVELDSSEAEIGVLAAEVEGAATAGSIWIVRAHSASTVTSKRDRTTSSCAEARDHVVSSDRGARAPSGTFAGVYRGVPTGTLIIA